MKSLLFCLTLFSSALFAFAQNEPINADTAKINLEIPAEDTVARIEVDKEVFVNLKSHSKPDGLEITWSLDYAALSNLADKNLVIKYNTNIGAKRNKKGYEGSDWKYSEPFELNKTSYEVKDLIGGEKYELYIGLVDSSVENVTKESDVIWSAKVKAKTERGWGVMKLLILIGSLGLFIFGMKVMSDGMQRTAGERLRKMLGSITSNRFKGVITGFSTTAIVQSSSVTTVMSVSLVNAGLLNLRQ